MQSNLAAELGAELVDMDRKRLKQFHAPVFKFRCQGAKMILQVRIRNIRVAADKPTCLPHV